MANAFEIFAEFRTDTNSFEGSLRDAEAALRRTGRAITEQEAEAVHLGKTTAVTARSYEKLTERVSETQKKLSSAADAFSRGAINSKQFQSAINSTERATNALNTRLKDSAARLADFKPPSQLGKFAQIGQVLTGVGAAFSAVSQVAGQAAQIFESTAGALFTLTKASADFGSMINDAAAKTGLSTDTLQALNFAATQGGVSFDEVSGSIDKFVRVLGSAKKGNEEAKKTMAGLGVTSNDLETALGQAYQTILKYPEGIEQMKASQEGFGRSGADMIPFLKEFGGSIPDVIKRARDLGLILDKETIVAADKFGDTLDMVGLQAKTSAARFTLAFAPAITTGMNLASKALTDNQATFAAWGNAINNALSDTIGEIQSRGGDWHAAGQVIGEKIGEGIGKGLEGIGGIIIEELKKNFRGDVSPILQPFLVVMRGLKDAGDDFMFGPKAGQAMRDAGNMMRTEGDKMITTALEKAQKLKDADSKAAQSAKQTAAEILETWKRGYSAQSAITDSFNRVNEAMVSARVRKTSQDELDGVRELAKVKKQGLEKQLAEATRFFRSELAILGLTSKQREAIEDDKARTIGKISTDLALHEINTAKQIAEAEDKILKQRRSALLEFKQIASESVSFNLDTSAFNFDSSISLGTATTEAFSRITDETQRAYAKIGAIIREQTSLQLQDESLSAEERVNINARMNLDVAKLAEEGGRRLLDISEKQNDQLVRSLQSRRDAFNSTLKAIGDLGGNLADIYFNPDTFGSKSTTKLVEFFRASTTLSDKVKIQFLQLASAIGDGTKGAKGFYEAQKLSANLRYDTQIGQLDTELGTTNDLIAAEKIRINNAYELEKVKMKSAIAAQMANRSAAISRGGEGTDAVTQYDEVIQSLQKNLADLEQNGAPKTSAAILQLNGAIKQLSQSREALKQGKDKDDLASFFGSPEGLQATIDQIKAVGAEKFFAVKTESDALLNQIGTYQSIADLKQRIANYSTLEPLILEAAQLQRILEIRQAITEKTIADSETFMDRIGMMQARSVSFSTAFKDSMADAVSGVADVISTSVAKWDGTFKGFFTSMLQGFAQLVQGIIQELIKVMVYQAIMKIISAAASTPTTTSLGTGAHSVGEGALGGLGGLIGHASGGLISGPGSGTSDSIFARLSNGEFVNTARAVRFWGRDFFEKVNNLQMPAFAGGGMVGAYSGMSSTNNNTTYGPTIHVNVNAPGGNPRQVQDAASRGVRDGMAKARWEERRNS